MKVIENNRTAGICDRRPKASTMPSGNDTTMPTQETTMVTRMPPHSTVSTGSRPMARQPVSRMKALIGNTTKK